MRPLVIVVRHGGLCVTGTECRTVLRVTDTTISGNGFITRRLRPADRVAFFRAIRALDASYLRSHPFTGTCPTAYDGAESIYRFAGFPMRIASCTFDVRRVKAVQVAERLLSTLKPRR